MERMSEGYKIEELILGLRCETCFDQRVFGHPPDSSPENLFVYLDLGGSTRVFCKIHMAFSKEKPCYGAQLISELLKP